MIISIKDYEFYFILFEFEFVFVFKDPPDLVIGRVGKIAIASLISAIATTIANSDSGSGYLFLDK